MFADLYKVQKSAMDTTKEDVADKGGEDKLILEGNASSTQSTLSDPADQRHAEVDLTSVEVTVQTSPSIVI